MKVIILVKLNYNINKLIKKLQLYQKFKKKQLN